MIQIIDKHKAKLIVNIGSGKNRKRRTKVVEYEKKRDLPRMYAAFEKGCREALDNRETVRGIVDSYIDSRERLGAKATTIKGYKACKNRLSTALLDEKASEVAPYLVDSFIAESADKYASKTIRNTMSLLSASFDRAIMLGLLKENPCLNVTMPKSIRKEVDIFTDDDVIRFVSALEREREDYKVGYKLALFCGLRRSEILGLREEHVNIPFRAVTVAETRHRVGKDDVVQDTKTKTSHRTLALPESLARDIDVLIKEHHALEYEHTDYLIQDGFGDKLNPSTFSSRLVRLEEKLNVSHVSVHGLRHTFATLLNAEGVDIAQISAELGHSNITTTLNTYTHVFGGTTASSRGIADKMNNKFGTSTALDEYEKTAEA